MGGSTATEIYLEVGTKRVFACAYDWPGWCRSGRDEDDALQALKAYLERYASVAQTAKLARPDAELAVLERLPGSGATDFGVPAAIPKRDSRASEQVLALVGACWTIFDQVVKVAPAELRKGPRGGGRDRDAMFDHVLGAEMEYAKRFGVRLKQPDGGDKVAVRAFRKAIREGLGHPGQDAKWPAPYAARRTAWHALDHAWEIEDRSTP